MMNRFITSLLAKELMRAKQMIKFSLRLFTLRVRLIERRILMQHRNLMKNDTTKVELRKKELEQSLVQHQNPLKNVLESMERDLKLSKDFFLGDNVDNEKIIRMKKDEKIQH